MPLSGSASSADQEFLALLVHKGFLEKEDAMGVLKGVGEDGFDASLATVTGWNGKRQKDESS